MAQGISILDQAGPLPINNKFVSDADGPVVLLIFGSVWATTENQMIGFKVILNGTQVATAQIFSNGTEAHRAVVPAYIMTNVNIGPQTVELTPLNAETVSDFNDQFHIFMVT